MSCLISVNYGFPHLIITYGARGYEEGMDGELQELFNYALSKRVTLFDTADSYVESHIHKHDSSMIILISLLAD